MIARPDRTGTRRFAPGAVLFAASLAGCGEPIQVDAATVARGTIEERVSSAVSGDVEPRARAVLRAESVGRVTKVSVEAGQVVDAGQELLRLDDRALAAAAAAARVQRDNAERELQTAEALAKKGAITDQALRQASAARDVARANLDVATANLERTRVRAPFGGLVSRLPVQEGDSVVIGQSIGELVDHGLFFVRAAFDEVDAVRIEPGHEAVVRLDAYPDLAVPGRVDRVDPVVGGDTLAAEAPALALAARRDRTVGVRVALAAKAPGEAKILVGMSADVEVVLRRHEGVLRVPSAAVFHEKGKQFAYLLKGGRLKRREVTTGVSNWEFFEVLEGLKEGDRVLASLETDGIGAGVRAVPRPTR